MRQESQEGEKKTAQKNEDDFLDKDAKPDERKYLLAAKPFFIAVANRKYADAYALVSSHARARMSLDQFKPAQQDSDVQQNQSYAFDNVTAEQFAYLMQYVEAAHGAPRAPKMLHVFSTDADVLNRRSKEQFAAMDSMFAIGAMPDYARQSRPTIHATISLREVVVPRLFRIWRFQAILRFQVTITSGKVCAGVMSIQIRSGNLRIGSPPR